MQDLEDTKQIDKGLVTGAYLIGSALSEDCWPEDIDLLPVVSKEVDKETYWLMRNAMESDLCRIVPFYCLVESELDDTLEKWSRKGVKKMYISRAENARVK